MDQSEVKTTVHASEAARLALKLLSTVETELLAQRKEYSDLPSYERHRAIREINRLLKDFLGSRPQN